MNLPNVSIYLLLTMIANVAKCFQKALKRLHQGMEVTRQSDARLHLALMKKILGSVTKCTNSFRNHIGVANFVPAPHTHPLAKHNNDSSNARP